MSVRVPPAGVDRGMMPAATPVAVPTGVSLTPLRGLEPSSDGEGDCWNSAFASRQAYVNRQVTGLQLALAYLDEFKPRLRDLGRRLGHDGSVGETAAATISESLAQLLATWSQRHAISRGTLDADLEYFADGDALQRFRIRGLSAEALALPDAELLVFYPRGIGRPSRTLSLVAGEPADVRLQRLEETLAPAGIRVHDDLQGPLLTIAESAWPALSEQLLLHGGGKRFPSGWPSKAALDPVPGLVDPHDWEIDTHRGRQQTFRRVSSTLIRLEHMHAALSARLTENARNLHNGQLRIAVEEMHGLVDNFAATLMHKAGFLRLATAGACLRGMNRRKVSSVLDP